MKIDANDFKKHISIFLTDVYTFYTHFIVTFRDYKELYFSGLFETTQNYKWPNSDIFFIETLI